MKKVYDTDNRYAGVYGIRFLGEPWFAYYGSSANINQRFASHRSNLMRGTHVNSKLQEMYNKHGKDKLFMFVIGQIDDKNEREELEQKLIRSAPCANVVCGKGSTGRISSEEELEFKRAERLKNLDLPAIAPVPEEFAGFRGNTRSRGKLIRADREGNIVAIYNSTSEAQRAGFKHSGHISDCCNGKAGSYRGYRWSFQHAA